MFWQDDSEICALIPGLYHALGIFRWRYANHCFEVFDKVGLVKIAQFDR
jgi:hypothetical protein